MSIYSERMSDSQMISGNFEYIGLENESTNSPIVFLHAEVSNKYKTSLALIRYMIAGQKQQKGLRLDIDKRVFLDLPCTSQEHIAIAKEKADWISKVISRKLLERKISSIHSCLVVTH